MKKARIIAAILAVITIISLTFSINVSAENTNLQLDTQGKTDVLLSEEVVGLLNAHADGVAFVPATNLNDGVIASVLDEAADPATSKAGKVYLNKKSFNNEGEATEMEAAPGEFEFSLADGTKANYRYTIEFADLNVNVDSFAIYFNNENIYLPTYNGGVWSFWQSDAAFDILVSQDGGNTYSVAWQSARLTLTADGTAIETMASLLKEEGGNCQEERVKDASGVERCCYRYIAENFDKKYENVTNIVYACVNGRRSGDTDAPVKTTPFYYVSRISEFAVFGTVNEAAATEPETEPAATEPAATDPVATEPVATDPVATEPVATEPVATDPAATDKPADTKSGCGSVVGMGVALVAILGSAFVAKKKF